MKKVIFLILNLVFIVGVVSGFSDEVSICARPDLKPSYVIQTKVLNPIVNRGDTLKIEVYFSGYGFVNTNQSKLFILYPTSILDQSNPGTITSISAI